MKKSIIRIGSRDSMLAVAQSMIIINRIHELDSSVETELITMKTTGDKILNRTLDRIGGKGLFLKELDEALAEGRVDLCVHSLKDVPVEENPEYPVGAFSVRESPYDVLVLPENKIRPDFSLPVGCSSSRRKLQFMKLYPEAEVISVRGNIQTRLKKLDSGEFGALILAEAGLNRLGLQNRISYRFSADEIVPSAGQGIIAVQGRRGEYTELLKNLNNTESELCAKTERLVCRFLEGDCSAPIGAYAEIRGETINLRGFYSDGIVSAKAEKTGIASENRLLASELAEKLKMLINNQRSV